MTSPKPPQPPPPKALLFDIGGVIVTSPLHAIRTHERTQRLPPTYLNHAIARSAAWSQLETGRLALGPAFFAALRADLESPEAWREFHLFVLRKKEREGKKEEGKGGKEGGREEGEGEREEEEGDAPIPPPRCIDAEALFWEMMRVSRVPDRWMYGAVRRLRVLRERKRGQAAGGHPGWVLGALSNTIIFPAGVRDERNAVFESGLRVEGATGATRPLREGEKKKKRAEEEEGDDVRKLFDVFISSAHVGLRKPDRRIYELALTELNRVARERGVVDGVRAEEVLFLDDIGANLKGAREVGFRTLKVEMGKGKEAVRELERILGVQLIDDEDEVEDEKAKL